MPDEIDRYLNKLAQDPRASREGREWFVGLASDQQRVVLQKLWFFAAQAGAAASDVDAAISLAQLRPTDTPSVLLRGPKLSVAAAKVIGLPTQEGEKSYRLLNALFQVADKRRRETSCRGGCQHWWHLDRDMK